MNTQTKSATVESQGKVETPYLLYNGLADSLQRLIDQTKETIRLLGGEVR